MHTRTIDTTSETPQRVAGESATLARRPWVRTIAFWTTTLVVVFELVAGSLWNLKPLEWNVVQLGHLGYPHYLVYILGAWHVAAAIVIVAPGLPLFKEWAYAGCFILWSGAVASHLFTGDEAELWLMPLIFATCAIVSWFLRPADRRLPETQLRRDRAAAGHHRALETRARAWAVPLGLLILLYAASFLSLPPIERAMHQRAVELGWIE